MKLTVAFPTSPSRLNRDCLAFAGMVLALLMIATAFLAPTYTARILSDEQDWQIRSTLLTFNDSNMTGSCRG
jgi:hypothetical protein